MKTRIEEQSMHVWGGGKKGRSDAVYAGYAARVARCKGPKTLPAFSKHGLVTRDEAPDLVNDVD